MTTKSKALDLVRQTLNDLSYELGKPELANATPDLRLLGASSPLDSMALVSLIADLEGRIATEFGKEVVLADERAMSAIRSPFRSVGTLAEHIHSLVEGGSTPPTGT